MPQQTTNYDFYSVACNGNQRLHRIIAVCALAWGVGYLLVEALHIDTRDLEEFGLFLYWFLMFAMIAVVPYSAFSLIFCRKTLQQIIPNGTFLMFFTTLKLTKEQEMFLLITFLAYILSILFFWLIRPADKH